MKLATLDDGSMDGALHVVSRDLTQAVAAGKIASSLRLALENWASCSVRLQKLSEALNSSTAPGAFAFDSGKAAAPLPRAPQFLDGSVFLSHGQRMVKAFNLSTASLEVDHPLMYQGASDAFLGAHAGMPLPSEEHGIDIEAEIAVFTDFVPLGTPAVQAADLIRLVTLFDDVSLRKLLFGEMKLGFGMIQSKPTCVFAPVACTPDEFGSAWKDSRLHMTMEVAVNGTVLGRLATQEMGFSFADLVAHAARTRSLSAGTVLGSGTVSNEDTSCGVACIAERRALETLDTGAASTDWLKFNDRVRIEVFDENGTSVFGAIQHSFVRAEGGLG